jgi:hypothetical protein
MRNALFQTVTPVAGATHALQPTDEFLEVTYTVTGAVSIYTSGLVAGRTIVIKDAGGNAAVRNITLYDPDGVTPDYVISTNYGTVMLVRNGANTQWWIVDRN